ncbi:Beta-barrel assembly machine subunit BamE [Billgrantia gudaonensis]|uniref:Outer membrane protein assembly factor BamE n=2 Tax=Billgrantia gudaonensis TaxID=376427 RepID=A0A1G9CU44_9GAMM|nr:Beta-barrel assembly machine subunit BamE [Halomonas gudaonensis]
MIDRIHDSEEPTQMQKLIKTVCLTAALSLAGGCSYVGVYKRDLPQGNLVTEDMVEQLRPGMSQQQVVDVMGRPLLEAPFDATQWDYVFRLDEAYGDVQQRRLTLTFSNGQLADIDREGDFETDIELRPQEGAGPAVEGTDPTEALPGPAPSTTPDAPETGGTVPSGGEPSDDDGLVD